MEVPVEFKRKALITGITGQDGSYLAELLLSKEYEVHGVVRRCSTTNLQNIQHLLGNKNLKLHQGNMLDHASLYNVVKETQPDELYNLAAQSHVMSSFESPVETTMINSVGVLVLLEALRTYGMLNTTKFYQASTSELYGHVFTKSQDEDTPFDPVSPYGISKQSAFWSVDNYRRSYGLFGCNGILFNHESPRRGENFVTRKVTKYVGSYTENSPPLEMGNLDSVRDWGHARDYVKGMWLMLQQQMPNDYVLATGKAHTIRDMIEVCFRVELNKDIKWSGKGVDEIGTIETGPNQRTVVVKVNPKFYRPSEVGYLCGDPVKAEYVLNWKREYTFERLMCDMLRNDSYNPEAFKYGGSSE